jgi:hypothetical protein
MDGCVVSCAKQKGERERTRVILLTFIICSLRLHIFIYYHVRLVSVGVCVCVCRRGEENAVGLESEHKCCLLAYLRNVSLSECSTMKRAFFFSSCTVRAYVITISTIGT